MVYAVKGLLQRFIFIRQCAGAWVYCASWRLFVMNLPPGSKPGWFCCRFFSMGPLCPPPCLCTFYTRRCAFRIMDPIYIVLIVLGAILLAGISFFAGVFYRKKVGEREIGSAEQEATRIINEALRSGESRKKEMLVEARDEIHKSRTEHEKEVKERRAELSKQERRLEQKETTLDKKTEAFERKEEELNKKLQKVAETQAQAEEIKKQQMETLGTYTDEELNKLALIAPKATVNVIRDFQVVEKKKLVMPEEIHGIAKCRNPKCVTNNQPVKTWFKTIDNGNEISLLCHYCEKVTDSKHIF